LRRHGLPRSGALPVGCLPAIANRSGEAGG
jgi:hypothetical protein